MSETAGEKTFAPTEKRLADAAKKGDVLRSKDAGTAAVMLLGGAWLALAGPWLLEGLAGLARDAFLFDARDIRDFTISGLLMKGLLLGVPAILTLAVPVILVTLLTQLAFGRGRWVLDNLKARASASIRSRVSSGCSARRGWSRWARGCSRSHCSGALPGHGGGPAWKP